MSKELKERHPQLMVPHVYTFGVVLYTNGNAPTWPAEAVRDALIGHLPPGTGVGPVTCTSHGVHDHREPMPEPVENHDKKALYSNECLRNEARGFCRKYAKSDEEREAVRRFIEARFGLTFTMPEPMLMP